MSYEYGIYTHNGETAVHVESVKNLAQAQRIARDIAQRDKTESFVCNLKTSAVRYRVRAQSQHA